MLLLHAPNACDRNRAISCTNDLACLLALLELILFNRLPNKTEYPASTQNQTKESINIMNCWIIIAALNPPGTLNAHRADGWWRCCRRSPALDTGTAGRAWRWAAPWTAGPQKGWSILWKDVERFCGEIRRVTRCHTCETCETVYLHFLQLSHPRPILAVKWRRKEIRPEDYLVSMNAVSNSVAHKQLGEQLAHTAYI